mmetsp:Transcript_21940/g.52214  ORF Transcript_21940/g.52214 Transcript_21940/m.52214 type:complete len:203 (-) Transcript_21940:1607-2215(-)
MPGDEARSAYRGRRAVRVVEGHLHPVSDGGGSRAFPRTDVVEVVDVLVRVRVVAVALSKLGKLPVMIIGGGVVVRAPTPVRVVVSVRFRGRLLGYFEGIHGWCQTVRGRNGGLSLLLFGRRRRPWSVLVELKTGFPLANILRCEPVVAGVALIRFPRTDPALLSATGLLLLLRRVFQGQWLPTGIFRNYRTTLSIYRARTIR